MSTSLRRKGILIVALPACVSLIFLIGLFRALQGAESDLRKQVEGSKLSALAANIQLEYYQLILAVRQWHSTRSPDAGATFDKLIARVQKKEQELEAVAKPNENLARQVRVILADAAQARAFLFKVRNGASTHFGGDLDPRIFHKTGLSFMDALTEDFRQLNDSAEALVSVADSSRSRDLAVAVMAVGALANIGVAILLALYFSSNIGNRIGRVQENALRLASGKSLGAELGGGDEIGQLDKTFHQMAAALQEAGDKETALLDNAGEVLCSIDGDLRFVRVSAATTALWGYAPEEIIGMRVKELIVAGLDELALAVKGKIAEGGFDAALKRRDGKTIDVHFSAYWSESEKTLYCVVRDVTREREFERIKQQLMDTIAHDLRSPITSIKIVLENLQEGNAGQLNAYGETVVGRAHNSADRLLRLVNDLLDYEKLGSGHFTLQLVVQSLHDLLHAGSFAVEGLSGEKKLRLEIEGEDVAVNVDGDKITQAIVNILANAVKFSPEGGRVVVSTKLKTPSLSGSSASASHSVSASSSLSSGEVLVEVADQGPGVPADMHDQVFERFRQVQSSAPPSTSGGHKGTGLGLPIARQIVEAHGGKIGLRDNQGGGAVFWFTLPIAEQKS